MAKDLSQRHTLISKFAETKIGTAKKQKYYLRAGGTERSAVQWRENWGIAVSLALLPMQDKTIRQTEWIEMGQTGQIESRKRNKLNVMALLPLAFVFHLTLAHRPMLDECHVLVQKI